ncbi:hypothetical protein [uncultured Rubinisphaera sp.]|uniref:hypothetical protein n=1 Tax=uncultured Rubinisphaera sp. TaxID=1678686 RepID=UPI0030D887B2
MTRILIAAIAAIAVALLLGHTFAQDEKPSPASDEAPSQDQLVRELRKENAELKKQLRELEKSVAAQSDLEKQVAGTSYRITFGKQQRLWTFGPNGVLLSNGKPTKTRWSAFGNEGVVCAGFDNGNVDIVHFSKEGKFCEVIFIGDFRGSSVRHPGELTK